MSYFAKLKKAVDENFLFHTSDFLKTLSDDEQQEMKNEIQTWGELDITLTRMLLKHYGEVTVFFARNLLSSNLELAAEEYMGRMNDTYGRELLHDTLAQYLGIRKCWPKHCDKDIDIEKFIADNVIPKMQYEISKENKGVPIQKRSRLI